MGMAAPYSCMSWGVCGDRVRHRHGAHTGGPFLLCVQHTRALAIPVSGEQQRLVS